MKGVFVYLLLFSQTCAFAQTYSWEKVAMDGSRTGCRAPMIDDVHEALGTVSGRTYIAPNGKVYKGGCLPKVVSIVSDAQEGMSVVKKVIGYSTERMTRMKPECALSDMYADWLIDAVAEKSGGKVDVSIVNFGGVRTDMPKGDIIIDDIKSMFPFNNRIALVSLKGARLREIYEQMVYETGIQIVGGARLSIEKGKLVSILVGGKPLDDSAVYGLATIDFLLDGGDNLFLSKDALDVRIMPYMAYDVILERVEKLTAAGKHIEYAADGRINIVK